MALLHLGVAGVGKPAFEQALAYTDPSAVCSARDSAKAELYTVRGRVLARLGDTGAAFQALESALAESQRLQSPMYQLRALEAMVRLSPRPPRGAPKQSCGCAARQPRPLGCHARFKIRTQARSA